MCKKIISLFTLTVFIVFTFSCYSTKVKRINTIKPNKMEKLEIREVVKISGEKIKFLKEYPGRIIENAIVADRYLDKTGFIKKRVSIPLSEVKLIGFKKFSTVKTIILCAGITLTAVLTAYLLVGDVLSGTLNLKW